jgi:hypothetical protein
MALTVLHDEKRLAVARRRLTLAEFATHGILMIIRTT